MEKKRNWLILTHCCNLDGRAASQHIDDRLPYLKREGITPLMLTGPTGPPLADTLHVQVYSPAPSGLRSELGYQLRTATVGRPWFRLFGSLLRLLVLPFYLIEKIFIDVEGQWSWFLTAAVRGCSLCARHDPEIIYSTGGPFSAHIAAAIIAARGRKPWIAELQDPLVHGDWQRSRRALRVYAWVERFVCRRADGVIFVTDEARRRATDRNGLGDRGWVVHPGADPGLVPPVPYRKGTHCRFAHFGSLAGSRNVTVFLDALERFFKEEPDRIGLVRLDLFGSGDRGVRERIQAFPYPDCATDHGRLTRKEAHAAMRQSDVLLLIQNKSDFSSETIPSKTYEYLQMGRPILGLVHKNPELEGVLCSQGHIPVDASDPGAVLRGIRQSADRWRESGFEGSTLPPSPYTVAAAVGRLIEVAGEIMRRRTDGIVPTRSEDRSRIS